jgi:hypothetical protein
MWVVSSGLARVIMADTPGKKGGLWPAVLAAEAELEQYLNTEQGAQVA